MNGPAMALNGFSVGKYLSTCDGKLRADAWFSECWLN